MAAYTTIDDPSAYFQATTYTGGGANTEVTNSGNSDLKPDFLWIKNRTAGYAHFVVDSNRNISYAQNSSNAPYLEINDTSVENNNQNWMASVNTDGFTTGISEHINNNSGSAYVAWQWKCNGGTKATNTAGSIDSVVQANTVAGFSIVTYTGTGGNITVGHGLGVAPSAIIIKSRTSTLPWVVWTAGMASGTTSVSELNQAGAEQTVSNYWYNGFSSTTFGLGTGTYSHNTNNANYIAYCFAEKQGYSKFGKYKGTGHAAGGALVYTGFKPAWVMVKKTNASGDSWAIFDNKRSTFNVIGKEIAANEGSAEYVRTAANTDFLSNGFKIRNTDGWHNAAGSTYIYMAFAENPFVTSKGVPATGR